MLNIDVMSKKPIYEQIIDGIENYISKGILKGGDAVQSVRKLSFEISVNPNTIQKAYTLLASEGIIFSVPGKGLFVCENAKEIINKKKEKTCLKKFREVAIELKQNGIDYKNAEKLLKEIFSEVKE